MSKHNYLPRSARPSLRERLHALFPFCWWCGGGLDLGCNLDTLATLEHLVPRNKGGSDDISNLRLAHHGCNK